MWAVISHLSHRKCALKCKLLRRPRTPKRDPNTMGCRSCLIDEFDGTPQTHTSSEDDFSGRIKRTITAENKRWIAYNVGILATGSIPPRGPWAAVVGRSNATLLLLSQIWKGGSRFRVNGTHTIGDATKYSATSSDVNYNPRCDTGWSIRPSHRFQETRRPR